MQRSNRNGHIVSGIKKLEIGGGARTIALGKRKGILIEDDMPRDDDSVGREIKKAVSFMMSGVSKEDAQSRPRTEFMWGGGRQVWVTFATENSQMVVCWRLAEEGKVRRGILESFGGQDVEQGGRRGECLDPVGGGHGGLKKQGANDIIYRTNNAFSFTILRRGVWTGHAKLDALHEEEIAGARVVKLLPVIALDSLDLGAKLGGRVGDEVGERAESVRFKTQRKSPQIMSTIIKYN